MPTSGALRAASLAVSTAASSESLLDTIQSPYEAPSPASASKPALKSVEA